ncbi:MAG: FG-GAP repeat domain-containing protein [Candidatus Brocadiia bacterium]
MRSKEHPDLANRILAFAGALCLVGFCFWVGLCVPENTGLIDSKTQTPPRIASPGTSLETLSLVSGPRIAKSAGRYAVEWETSRPTDALLTYGWADPFQHMVMEEEKRTQNHSVQLPNNPLMELHTFHVRSMDSSGNVVSATIGGGTGQRGQIMSDISSRYPNISEDIDSSEKPLWADFDADGDLDLVFTTSTGPLFFAQSARGFRKITADESVDISGKAMGWADVDRDGNLDLLCAGKSLAVYTNSGAPDFKFQEKIFAEQPPGAAEWKDAGFTELNGDGLPDIVARLPDDSLRYFANSRRSRPRYRPFRKAELPEKTDATRPFAADFDGDRRAEIVTSQLLGTTPSTHEASSREKKSSPPRILRIDDFDNDGQLDLLVQTGTKSGSVKFFKNTGSERFQPVAQSGALSKINDEVTCCATGDLTGNGYPDLVLNLKTIGPKIYFNAGDGNFIDATSLCDTPSPGKQAAAITITDVTGDSAPDIYLLLQDKAALLLENRSPAARRREFMTVRIDTRRGAIGATIRVRDAHASAVVGNQQIIGGCQPFQYSLGVGDHHQTVVEVLLSHGQTHTKRWIRGKSGNLLLFGDQIRHRR